MSPAELSARIAAAIEQVREGQAEQLADWAALYVAAGRAQQAAQAGDDEALRRHLVEACNLEFDLLGDCDKLGEIADALGIGDD